MAVMDEVESFKKAIEKNKKSPFTLIGGIVLIWVFFMLINIDISFLNIKLNYWLAIVISLSLLIWWLIIKYYPTKNKTHLPGVGFLISSDDIEKEAVEKDTFIKLLRNEYRDKFKIIVYPESDFKKYLQRNLKREEGIMKAMKDLNLFILLEVKERSGYDNNENNYEIEIIKPYFNPPYSIGFSSIRHLYDMARDFVYSINYHIKITHSNSLKDSKEEINMIELSLLYIMSYFQIFSPNPEEALNKLSEISGILRVTNLPKEEYRYISKSMNKMYLIAYQYTIFKLLDKEDYYKNADILKQIETYQNHLFELLIKSKSSISKKDYTYFYANYILEKTVLVYEQDGPNEALKVINRFDFTISNNIEALINKAFLLMMSGKIPDSVHLYMKIFKKDKEECKLLVDSIDFIDQRLKDDPDNPRLLFSYAILNYFIKDRKLALKYFANLELIDEIYKLEIENIKSMN